MTDAARPNLSKTGFVGCLALATALLTLRYLLAGAWLWALLSGLLGVFWWIEYRAQHPGLAHGLCIGMLALALVGLQRGFEAFWALIVLECLLGAWDLQHFTVRLQFAHTSRQRWQLEERHLQRLAGVLLLGFGCAGLALLMQVRLNFGLLLVLIAVAMVSLSRFIRHLRQESD